MRRASLTNASELALRGDFAWLHIILICQQLGINQMAHFKPSIAIEWRQNISRHMLIEMRLVAYQSTVSQILIEQALFTSLMAGRSQFEFRPMPQYHFDIFASIGQAEDV